MPPKKVVTDATKLPGADDGTPAKEQSVRDGVNIEDLNLPKSIVTRLAKGVLPPNTQIQGNAMLALSKSATVFVNYLAAHANELAHKDQRKTLSSKDVINALHDLEFPDWEDRLQAELDKWQEIQNDKRKNYQTKMADRKAGAAEAAQAGESQEGNTIMTEGESQLDKDGQPATKKARLDPNASGMDISEMPEDTLVDPTAEDDAGDDDNQQDDTEEEEEEGDHDETNEAEDQLEEPEEREAADEALDNGEDSD